jgi:hypothetical protein
VIGASPHVVLPNPALLRPPYASIGAARKTHAGPAVNARVYIFHFL